VDASHSPEVQDENTSGAAPGLNLRSVPKVAAKEATKQSNVHPAVSTSTDVSKRGSLFGDGNPKDSKEEPGYQVDNVLPGETPRSGLSNNKRKFEDDERPKTPILTPSPKRIKRSHKSTQDSASSSPGKGRRLHSVSPHEVNQLIEVSRANSPAPSTLILEDMDDVARVAFSNSAVSELDNLKKFLRSHGGVIVEDPMKEECNLLW